jgi:hypothetical protein
MAYLILDRRIRSTRYYVGLILIATAGDVVLKLTPNSDASGPRCKGIKTRLYLSPRLTNQQRRVGTHCIFDDCFNALFENILQHHIFPTLHPKLLFLRHLLQQNISRFVGSSHQSLPLQSSYNASNEAVRISG